MKSATLAKSSAKSAPAATTDTLTLPESGIVTAPESSAPAAEPINLESALEFLKLHYGIPSVSLVERGVKAALVASRASARHGSFVAEAVRYGVPVESNGKTTSGTVSRRKTLQKGAKLDYFLATLTKEQKASRSLSASQVSAAETLGIIAE
jgi:hypothetical protein